MQQTIDTPIVADYNLIVPTIYDVAKRAGVSAATVSRAFNSPGLISVETQRHIIAIAHGMDYKPLRARGRLLPKPARPETSTLVGFHLSAAGDTDPLRNNPFYSNVLAGALSEATRLGIQLVLSSSNRRDSGAMVSCLGDQTLQAGILIGVADRETIKRVSEQVPYAIVVGAHDSDDRCDSILIDNLGGGAAATRYLIEQGHRRIAFLLGSEPEDSFLGRLDGFVTAHYHADLPISQDLIFRARTDLEVQSDRIAACLTGPNPPTAFVAANDDFAYALLRICHALGLSVPGEISIVGFDDLPFSAQCWPPLTTMRVDMYQIGCIAVRRLWQKIAGPNDTGNQGVHIVVPVELIERQSCRTLAAS